MWSEKSSYRLRRFLKASEPQFAAALQIYVRNTPVAMRTDTNEISYWLERFTEEFRDPFYVFGFYRNRQLVGYAQAAYLTSARLIALDYIAIDEAHRGNHVFYEFVDQLRRFLVGTHPEYRFASAEVTYGPGQSHPTRDSIRLTRLLKMQGFGLLQAPYYQPRLMLEHAETEMRADLLIVSSSRFEAIQTETYLEIVRTLYYQYYLPWKTFIPDSKDDYKKHLNDLYSRITRKVGNHKTIVVESYRDILVPSDEEPIVNISRVVGFSALGVAVVILLTTSMLILKSIFDMSDRSFSGIYILALVSFFALAAVVSKEARAVFGELIMLLKNLFDKKAQMLRPNERDRESSSRKDPGDQ